MDHLCSALANTLFLNVKERLNHSTVERWEINSKPLYLCSCPAREVTYGCRTTTKLKWNLKLNLQHRNYMPVWFVCSHTAAVWWWEYQASKVVNHINHSGAICTCQRDNNNKNQSAPNGGMHGSDNQYSNTRCSAEEHFQFHNNQ